VTAVRDEISGVLIDGHRADDWAKVLGDLMVQPGRRRELGAGALAHARGYSWSRTASGLLAVYREAMSEQQARINAELGLVLQRDRVGANV
jgi:D-inositol-3-phosphate glycosyltransferase